MFKDRSYSSINSDILIGGDGLDVESVEYLASLGFRVFIDNGHTLLIMFHYDRENNSLDSQGDS